MSKEFWYKTWEILEQEAVDKYNEMFGKDPTEIQVRDYCEHHIEERNRDRMADMIDHERDRMKCE